MLTQLPVSSTNPSPQRFPPEMQPTTHPTWSNHMSHPQVSTNHHLQSKGASQGMRGLTSPLDAQQHPGPYAHHHGDGLIPHVTFPTTDVGVNPAVNSAYSSSFPNAENFRAMNKSNTAVEKKKQQGLHEEEGMSRGFRSFPPHVQDLIKGKALQDLDALRCRSVHSVQSDVMQLAQKAAGLIQSFNHIKERASDYMLLVSSQEGVIASPQRSPSATRSSSSAAQTSKNYQIKSKFFRAPAPAITELRSFIHSLIEDCQIVEERCERAETVSTEIFGDVPKERSYTKNKESNTATAADSFQQQSSSSYSTLSLVMNQTGGNVSSIYPTTQRKENNVPYVFATSALSTSGYGVQPTTAKPPLSSPRSGSHLQSPSRYHQPLYSAPISNSSPLATYGSSGVVMLGEARHRSPTRPTSPSSWTSSSRPANVVDLSSHSKYNNANNFPSTTKEYQYRYVSPPRKQEASSVPITFGHPTNSMTSSTLLRPSSTSAPPSYNLTLRQQSSNQYPAEFSSRQPRRNSPLHSPRKSRSPERRQINNPNPPANPLTSMEADEELQQLEYILKTKENQLFQMRVGTQPPSSSSTISHQDTPSASDLSASRLTATASVVHTPSPQRGGSQRAVDAYRTRHVAVPK